MARERIVEAISQGCNPAVENITELLSNMAKDHLHSPVLIKKLILYHTNDFEQVIISSL